MRTRALWLLLLAVLLLSVACGDDDDDNDDDAAPDDDSADDDTDDDDDATPDDDDDDDTGDDDTTIEDLPQWLRDRPYLQNRMEWRQDIDMSAPLWPRKLGAIGVGNGRVFGILGNQYPLGSWHNLGGPNYQKNDKWFTDKEPWLAGPDGYIQPTQQAISRVRNAPIVITTADNGLLEWTGVSFAPKYSTDTLTEQALINVWIVRNLGEEVVSGLNFVLDSNFGEMDDGVFVEPDYESRTLNARPLELTATTGGAFNDMYVPLGDLAPGEEIVFTLPFAFCEQGEHAEDVFTAVADAGVDALLEATVAWWEQWQARMVAVDSPDAKFNDLLPSLAYAIKVNQAVSGGVAQMSQYSLMWLRDTYGPALFYPLIGLNDDFRDMLDYMFAAVVVRGNISNAIPLDVDVSNPPAQPDWENLPTLHGHQRCESPSHIPLEYEKYYRMTGDLDRLEEAYGMLKHSLVHQVIIDDCLQYFSADETFEDVMQAAFGFWLLHEPDTEWYSAYSSYFMIRAATFMSELAGLLGYAADQALFAQMVDDFKTCLEDDYWMEDERMYAIMLDTATMDPWDQPYEDISPIPIWLDALPLDDPHVVANFETLVERLGRDNGTAVTPMHPIYNMIFPHVDDGVQSGMSHGYYLINLTKMFHPMADAAFAMWEQFFTPAGFTDEALVTDDYGHLSILREPFGYVSDVSARFRSWESGIMGHAYLYYLTGIEIDVPGEEVHLAPHLPPDWPYVALDGLAFGDGRFALRVEEPTRGGRKITLTTDAPAAFTLHLTVPLDGAVSGVSVDGTPLAGGAYEAQVNDYGRTVVTIMPLEITANDEVIVEVTLSR
ncbi:MAG TPA: hypothetical protein PKW95_20065 [bacterium]|nr:hypothetical protein [bacterium]